MPDNIGLIIAFAVPVLLLTVLRINAVMVFLSLCLGEVLVKYVADDASTMLNLFSSHPASIVSKSMLQLALLIGPAILTGVFMIFSVKGRSKVLLNILPAAGTAFLGVVLAVPLLAPGLRHAIESEQAWHQLTRAQALVLGVSAIISLLFMWTQRHTKSGSHSSRSR
jgi:hypothetical protein